LGDQGPPVHFATINDRDGFYIISRRSEPDFRWSNLEGATLVPASFAFQPEACLRFALKEEGVDFGKIDVVRGLNGINEAQDAFRKGRGDTTCICKIPWRGDWYTRARGIS
jgi:NitT/TauT family transport system substrate-binding protein